MSERIEPKFSSKQPGISEQNPSNPGPIQINFRGTAGEYFGIWIVNAILSIITIGIYSAWAKVKRETYFKNNTKIGETSFGYHATGMQIFKGRLIAFAVLVLINIAATFYPVIGGAIFVILIFLIPLIINNSMRFSARVTSFRNIRFNWHGTYGKSFWFFVIAPVVSILSLGILMPLISKAYYAYFARSHSYGTSSFSCDPKVKDYYVAYGVGVILPVFLIIASIAIFVFATLTNLSGGLSLTFAALGTLLPWTIILVFVLTTSIYRVLCRNLMMRSLTLSDVANFDSTINPIKYVWIRLSNLIVIILSLGLMLPWATIRAHKYLSECSKIIVTGDLEKFIDDAIDKKSSFGEEFAELEGLEVTI